MGGSEMSRVFAIYYGLKLKCNFEGNNKILLISKQPLDNFRLEGNVYCKIVDRSDCDRVYRVTPKVKYQGEEYDYYEETEDKIRLYVIASDLSLEWEPKGFQHTDYEEWTKWVPKSECEKFDKIEDY